MQASACTAFGSKVQNPPTRSYRRHSHLLPESSVSEPDVPALPPGFSASTLLNTRTLCL